MTLLTSMNFSNICPPLPYYWSPTIYRSSVFLKTRPGHSPLALAVGFLRHAPISRNLAIPSLVAIMTFDQFFYVTNLARCTMSTRSHGRQPLSIKQAPRVHVDQPCHLMHCLRYLRLQHQVSISVRQACENQPVRTYRPRLGHPFWRSYALHCTNSPNRPFFPSGAWRIIFTRCFASTSSARVPLYTPGLHLRRTPADFSHP